jgi:hypothetical protein
LAGAADALDERDDVRRTPHGGSGTAELLKLEKSGQLGIQE